ncbi:PREDICTED: poly [ADP-ribose] polymerase 1-like [Amphimedon queenslandica]|uniref:Poly [ADP-ribose] polymerase n=2 Tax=Amphimedon queenslandica TaxID=400682 RepID=A0A1X7VAR1_AMPQE|nr:PREDICTED: poly [ADP-ribose] polymerase 1-like [Amphimedon queenslandica]|eukprot:XP_003385071.1 PREDICTED: poly [ADP-ribose] polymerase 1-like [Amphimedon queenslandica]
MADDDPPYRTEYAKSNRSSCKACRETIAKDSLRMARMVQAPNFDAKIPHWYHFSCFFGPKMKLVSVSQIGGMGGLRWDDQQKIQAKIDGGGGATAGKKRKKGKSADGEENATKKQKKTESPEDKALREQNEMIWKIRDKLESHLTKGELKDLLDANGQAIPKGESCILDACADGMVFGSLGLCEECGGQLRVRTHSYSCAGFISDWTKCTNTTTEAKRRKWVIPKQLKEYDFLKSYKYVPRTRVFPEAPPTPSPSVGSIASSSSQQPIDPSKPLSGFKIASSGRLSKTKGELKKLIVSLGGEMSSTVNRNTTLLISNEAEVEENSSTAICAASRYQIPVVDIEYLDDVASGDALGKVKSHTISSWTASPHLEGSNGREETDSAVFEKVPLTVKMKVKGGGVVDPDSGLDSSHHIYEQSGEKYTAVLGLVDITKGTNSYYKLQLLESDSGKSYYLFRAWGRVGTTIGGNKLEDFGYDLDDALSEFLRLYQEKTGTSWHIRKHARKVPGKFYPIDIDYGEEEGPSLSLSGAGSNSKLAPEIQDLIKMIFDIQKMKDAMMEFEIDMKKMPLGKLSKRQILSAYSVLNELQNELTGAKNPSRILDGSNRFYTLIPHDFGMAKPPLLETEEMIKSKILMLDNLKEIEIAYSLLKTEGEGSADKDPLDIHYEKLKTNMSVLDKESEEFKRLVEYVANTHAATHNQYQLEVQEVFNLERHGEKKRYKPFSKLENRMLLWHGSRLTNFVGILSQGLRIAPPEAPVTGYMFGKGVYFADMVSKSANYCWTSPQSPVGLMLLCEVALGNMYEREHADYITSLPAGKHSTKGIGRTAPDPTSNYVSESGAIIPMGKGTTSSSRSTSLLYNEYIVYDVAQINMKYLIKMNFKYRR